MHITAICSKLRDRLWGLLNGSSRLPNLAVLGLELHEHGILSDMVCDCSFSGESMDPDGTLAYAYYKEGASQPTFLFPKYALKEQKC